MGWGQWKNWDTEEDAEDLMCSLLLSGREQESEMLEGVKTEGRGKGG